MREVIVRDLIFKGGLVSVNARVIWESEPSQNGDRVRLDRSDDGRWWFTFTALDAFASSDISVEVTVDDLVRLHGHGIPSMFAPEFHARTDEEE